MKQVINKEDIVNIVGKWVVQLTNEQENFKLTDSQNDGFWLEKRISFVGRLYGVDGYPNVKFENKEELIIMNGLYYTHCVKTPDEFVKFFNEYTNGERFHRLLTTKELDWLNERLKRNLY